MVSSPTTGTKKKTVDSTAQAVLSTQEKERDVFEVSLTKAQEQAGKRGLAADVDIDLEENAPEPVKIACREYRLVPLLDEKGEPLLDERGEPRKRREAFTRMALIDTFIPTELLFKTVLLQGKLKEMSAANTDQAAWMKFYAERVLEIWRLSEPDMTYDRLIASLDFPKIRGLFARFFASLFGGIPT